MALGSTQPLTEMSTRRISWGKGGRCLRLCVSRNLGTLTSWKPLGLFRPVMGLLYLYLYFVSQPIYVSGIFIAHHQEVYCIYTV